MGGGFTICNGAINSEGEIKTDSFTSEMGPDIMDLSNIYVLKF